MSNKRRQSVEEMIFINKKNNVSPTPSTSSSDNSIDEIGDDLKEINILNIKRTTERRSAVKPAPIRRKTLYFCIVCSRSIYDNDECYICCKCTSISCKSCNDNNKCTLCYKKLSLLTKNDDVNDMIAIKKSRCFCFF